MTKPTGEIDWCEPPRDARQGQYGELLAPFRDRPGEWGKLPGDYYASLPQNIKNGRFAGIRRGEFDVVARGRKGCRVQIWVRFVPESER